MDMDIDNLWGERDPQETEALRCLVDAEAYLGMAILNDFNKAYLKALQLSERVIQHFPRCATAHYFAGLAHLKATGDKNFAKQKYELLTSLESEEANILAKKLIDKIEETKVRR